jgi:hypothetical protein
MYCSTGKGMQTIPEGRCLGTPLYDSACIHHRERVADPVGDGKMVNREQYGSNGVRRVSPIGLRAEIQGNFH